MDALTYILIAMAAILFSWIGYFLGNVAPVSKKGKRAKEARKMMGQSLLPTDGVKTGAKKAMNWLLEREEAADTEESGNSNSAQLDAPASTQPAPAPTPVSQPVMPDLMNLPEGISSEALMLWYDRRKKKLMAKIDKDIVDVDKELSTKQHAALSMLLVDLQEKVGIAATVKAALSEETDKLITEKDRARKTAPDSQDSELEKPSFHPLKSFVRYVQADVPKIDDKPVSIPEQINAILQRDLEGTALENRGIAMRDWPGRGVVFIVGINVYDDIHQIPDSEIRLAIRKAVKTWEDLENEK